MDDDRVFIGFDSRFRLAYDVAVDSLRANTKLRSLKVFPIVLSRLKAAGLYYRPMRQIDGHMYDDISAAPMSTEFAISRFLVPFLSNYKGWSIFCDSDFLFRADIKKVFDMADSRYAVMCVKHQYEPPEKMKMDGQLQQLYARKNWSSFMLFNNKHPANRFLNVENINQLPGRDLHRFCWLQDQHIGDLPQSWNWLEGHSDPEIAVDAVHYTRGTPDLPGYENAPFADEWRSYACG